MGKKIFLILIAAFGLIFKTGLSAGETNFSLSNCLFLAENSNPDILKGKKKIDESNLKIVQSGSAFLPSVSVSGLLSSLEDVPPAVSIATIGTAIHNPLLQYSFQDNFSASLKVSMPLFTGGRNFALLKTAIYDFALNKAQLNSQRNQVRLDVTRNFYGIMVNQEMKALAEDTIAQLQRRVALVSNLLIAGTATAYDLMKTRVQLSSWSARLVEILKNLNSARNRLSYLTGHPVGREFNISGNLQEPDVSMITQDSVNSESFALKNRPELKVVENLNKIGNANVMVKLSSMLPQANLQFEQNYLNKVKDPNFDENNWYDWWVIRLGVTWDFFSFGRSRRSPSGAAGNEREGDRSHLGQGAGPHGSAGCLV